MARALQKGSGMLHVEKNSTLTTWLQAVNGQLQARRIETQSLTRPKRNRERERARREARILFSQFYAEQAMGLAN